MIYVITIKVIKISLRFENHETIIIPSDDDDDISGIEVKVKK